MTPNQNPMKPDSKNFILAIVLSMAIIFVWQYFFVTPQLKQQAAQQQTTEQTTGGQTTAQPGQSSAGAQVPGNPATAGAVTREQAIATSQRVKIDTPFLEGSINLTGAALDDLKLKQYRETTDKTSPIITLLTPSGAPNAYFAEQGFVATPGSTVKLPDSKSVWTLASGSALTATTPVTLTFDNGEGLVFSREISLSDDYVFTIKQSVENKSQAPVSLVPYARVQRQDTPHVQGFYVFFEGMLGVQDGTLTEAKYHDVAKDDGKITKDAMDPDSIGNEVGAFGRRYGPHSMMSRLSPYGDPLSETSAFNPTAKTPPKVFVGDKFMCYVTMNHALNPRVDTKQLLLFLGIAP